MTFCGTLPAQILVCFLLVLSLIGPVHSDVTVAMAYSLNTDKILSTLYLSAYGGNITGPWSIDMHVDKNLVSCDIKFIPAGANVSTGANLGAVQNDSSYCRLTEPSRVIGDDIVLQYIASMVWNGNSSQNFDAALLSSNFVDGGLASNISAVTHKFVEEAELPNLAAFKQNYLQTTVAPTATTSVMPVPSDPPFGGPTTLFALDIAATTAYGGVVNDNKCDEPTPGENATLDSKAGVYNKGDTAKYSCKTDTVPCSNLYSNYTSYESECLGNNQWTKEPLSCCLRPFHRPVYVGCYQIPKANQSEGAESSCCNSVELAREHCRKSDINKKLTLIVGLNSNGTYITFCYERDDPELVKIDESICKSNENENDYYGYGEGFSGGKAIASAYESMYGCYRLKAAGTTSPMMTAAAIKWIGNSKMTGLTCNRFCLKHYGPDKHVYTYSMNGTDCYCIDSATMEVERDYLYELHAGFDECMAKDCSGGQNNVTGCGADQEIVIQSTDDAFPEFGADETCFKLWKDKNIIESGWYYFEGRKPEYCGFYDGTYCESGWIGFNGQCYQVIQSEADYQTQELECAKLDAHLATVLNSRDSSVQMWFTDFVVEWFYKIGFLHQTMWIGGYDPLPGDNFHQVMMWNDGSLIHETSPDQILEGHVGWKCMYAYVHNASRILEIRHHTCNITRRALCQKPSVAMNGVRSLGCWLANNHEGPLITSMEGKDMSLTDHPLTHADPVERCRAVLAKRVDPRKRITAFGIKNGECHFDDKSSRQYHQKLSTSCKSGIGSADSYNMYLAEDIPQGYIGCYAKRDYGDSRFQDPLMTITLCREVCLARGSYNWYYQYAALENDTCHCFRDFFDEHSETHRTIMSDCNLMCPGNEMQRCGRDGAHPQLMVFSAGNGY